MMRAATDQKKIFWFCLLNCQYPRDPPQPESKTKGSFCVVWCLVFVAFFNSSSEPRHCGTLLLKPYPRLFHHGKDASDWFTLQWVLHLNWDNFDGFFEFLFFVFGCCFFDWLVLLFVCYAENLQYASGYARVTNTFMALLL